MNACNHFKCARGYTSGHIGEMGRISKYGPRNLKRKKKKRQVRKVKNALKGLTMLPVVVRLGFISFSLATATDMT